MTSYIEKTGAIVQVTGRMCDFNKHERTIAVSVEPEDIKVVRNAPQPGSKIFHRCLGTDRVYTISDIRGNLVYTTEDDGGFFWSSVVELTPEKEAEIMEAKKKKQEDEWRKQAAAIPVPLLLESIQERIQK